MIPDHKLMLDLMLNSSFGQMWPSLNAPGWLSLRLTAAAVQE